MPKLIALARRRTSARHAFHRHGENLRRRHGMNVELFGERLLELRDVGDMREQAQFDLAVIRADELHALGRDEGLADAAAFLGADRNVLQVRIGRGEAAGRGRRHRIGRMHAARVRIDVARQRVGIGAAQFRELAPVQHLLRDVVALGRDFFQNVGIGRPRAGLGLLAAGQRELAEQDIAELLGRADVEFLAGELVDVFLHLRLQLARNRWRGGAACRDRS